MADREVTFFGEVGALRSRATWSDSEEEEEDVNQDVNMEDGSGQVVAESLVLTPNDFKPIPTQVLYVSTGEPTKKSTHPVLVEVHSSSDPKIMARVVQLSSSESWLAVDVPSSKMDSFQTVNLVHGILTRFLSLVEMVVVVTVMPSEKQSVEYICNRFTEGKETAARFCGPKALPPTMVTSVPEAAAFELCTTRGIPCSLLIIPNQETCRSPRVIKSIDPDVLSCSLKCLLSQSHLDSNIYI